MPTPNLAVVKNSTNVRIPASIRWSAQALGFLAPARAEELAVRLFCTPRRTRAPEAPSPEGHRFTIESGAHHVAAWEWGEGKTVLLVHGWEGRARQMSPFVAPLVEAGFHVVAFDHPAHGFSSGEQVTGLDLADAVFAVGYKFRPVSTIVAHSLGATAATIALARGLSAERVVLIAPAAEPTPYARALASALGLSEARTEGMLGRLRALLGGDFDKIDLRKLAPRMAQDMLLVHDPDDPETPFSDALAIARAWPGARVSRAHGLGHRQILKDPATIETVVRFVSARSDALERLGA